MANTLTACAAMETIVFARLGFWRCGERERDENELLEKRKSEKKESIRF
jgi:hypothetical protein